MVKKLTYFVLKGDMSFVKKVNVYVVGNNFVGVFGIAGICL